jgi:hypothetical protein
MSHRLRRRYGHAAGRYGFTVIIPFAERGATQWHPTDRTGPFSTLSRGFFQSKKAAHKWAKEHLGLGAKYSLRRLGRY